LIHDKEDRWLFLGIVVIAANAGGAWSPIGDVTTTMLWIGGQLTSKAIFSKLFLPSLLCLFVPVLVVSFRLKGAITEVIGSTNEKIIPPLNRNIIFITGLGILLCVPVFKSLTHLPPFMGMLLGLGILWIISEFLNKDKDTEDKDNLSVVYALRKIDTPSILFFLGILIAISALDAAGLLSSFAQFLDQSIGNQNFIVMIIGLFSAIVDNVPLVAATTGMYDLHQYPTDHSFWQFLAYSTGTGGSVLIIGSAAGVAAMGMEKMDFFWYLKKISWLALIGFLSGAIVYVGFIS
jgi:Na+/H+ antiporter NhaD/arsenite permease-like protein